jgi:acetylornithine deacetylase
MADEGPQREALRLAEAGREESVARLAELVRVPSLTGEEGPAQACVAGLLRSLGAETALLEPDTAALFRRFPAIAQYPTHWRHDLILGYEDLPTYEALQASGLEDVLNYRGRPNVVGVFKGAGGGRSLILNGHIDTVTVEPRGEWTRDPFGAEIADGFMYGRGASDMKGGLMAAVMAMAFLKRAGVGLKGDVILESVVNEEHAGNGTLDLVRRGILADAALVLEPTNNGIAVSCPGGLYWRVTVPGVSRSPGARWRDGAQEGVSAIEKLPAVIEALLALERRLNRTPSDDPMERGRQPFALVFGKVGGGHYDAVTAGEALLRGGAYFAPGVGDVSEVMAMFRDAVAGANANDEFLSRRAARLEFLHHDDSARQSPQMPFAALMGERLRARAADGEAKPGPFCCDMRHLVNQAGIPTVVFGPGAIAEAHRPDEKIELAEYLACIGHLIEFIPAWCNLEKEEKRNDAESA